MARPATNTGGGGDSKHPVSVGSASAQVIAALSERSSGSLF